MPASHLAAKQRPHVYFVFLSDGFLYQSTLSIIFFSKMSILTLRVFWLSSVLTNAVCRGRWTTVVLGRDRLCECSGLETSPRWSSGYDVLEDDASSNWDWNWDNWPRSLFLLSAGIIMIFSLDFWEWMGIYWSNNVTTDQDLFIHRLQWWYGKQL